MLYKTFRSVCILLFLIMISSTVRADSIPIRFSQLEEFASATSPSAQIIIQEFEKVKAQRDAELTWSNPEIAYNREKIDELEEYQISIGKSFTLPWTYFKKRSAWNYRMESATLLYKNKVTQYLSDLKRDYVRIKLFDEYLSRLGQLKKIIDNASNIANSKYIEGHLSGVEEHLIQMVVISLRASNQVANQERRQVINNWQAKLGIQLEDNTELVTVIVYKTIDVKLLENDINLIERNPEYLAHQLMSQSLDKFASVARSKFIPDINIYGGYKKIAPDYTGNVFGISLSIPLFNRNRAEVRSYVAGKKIVESETEILKSHLFNRSKNLIESISESQLVLAVFSDHFEEHMEALDNILYSYDEGWIDLNDLLNAIQIEVSGLKDYYDQLYNYYSNIFELEAILGKTLIAFNE